MITNLMPLNCEVTYTSQFIYKSFIKSITQYSERFSVKLNIIVLLVPQINIDYTGKRPVFNTLVYMLLKLWLIYIEQSFNVQLKEHF